LRKILRVPAVNKKGFKYNLPLYLKPVSFSDAVSFLEFVDATARIDEFLLSCKEGVAFIADVHFKRFYVFGRAGLEGCAASAYNRYFVIIRMYIGLHFITSLIIFTVRTCSYLSK